MTLAQKQEAMRRRQGSKRHRNTVKAAKTALKEQKEQEKVLQQ